MTRHISKADFLLAKNGRRKHQDKRRNLYSKWYQLLYHQSTVLLTDPAIQIAAIAMSTFNVLRWSSLAAGIIYGAYHTEVLKSIGAKKQEQFEFEQKQKLIAEAKAQYAKLHPVAAPAATGASVELNLDDPNTDFAEFILSAVNKLGN